MADTQPPKKKFGFKDLRTAAELALAPGRPLSRNPPPIANVQFGGKFGAFVKAAALTGAGFAAFSSALAQKQSLSSLSARSNDSAKNRGVKRAPFVVLIGATMPSVLAEIGFLTNPTDEALLKKSEYRQKIAEALYKGIAAYAESLSRFQLASR